MVADDRQLRVKQVHPLGCCQPGLRPKGPGCAGGADGTAETLCFCYRGPKGAPGVCPVPAPVRKADGGTRIRDQHENRSPKSGFLPNLKGTQNQQLACDVGNHCPGWCGARATVRNTFSKLEADRGRQTGPDSCLLWSPRWAARRSNPRLCPLPAPGIRACSA